MVRRVFLAVVVSVFVLSSPGMAKQNTLFISGGGSWDADGTVRFSYVRDVDWQFWSSSLGHFTPSVEVGAGWWFSSAKTGVHADVTPMFRYVFHTGRDVVPFVEGGAGASYISYEQFGGQDLGSHFQFRDVAGVGVAFGPDAQYSMHARYEHYSNADLADENDGLDFWVLGFGMSF
ncbi:acyloxyacyl hydrolase [Desulfovermiculus halophilus]|jgi:hypothetical protein|uniref:acyloxyacyl hydrolase n=1 Tax=Desulfovermiculus halophilus TaxID=339722 RepID=UPI0006884B3D|nr:acyloxyacyl hydrolase [Desulfovermiculus halophilus]